MADRRGTSDAQRGTVASDSSTSTSQAWLASSGGGLPARPVHASSSVMSRSLLTAVVVGAATTAGLFAACKADDARTDVMTCEIVYRVCPSLRRATADEARECAEIFQGACGAHMRQYMQ